MIIERTGHFYAAHRNQELRGDKCFGLHGHTYHITVGFKVGERDSAGVTILFSDLESKLNRVLNRYDHALLLDKEDRNLRDALRFLETQDNQDHKTVEMDGPTSVENLAERLYNEIGPEDVEWVRVKETNSSTVVFRGSQ